MTDSRDTDISSLRGKDVMPASKTDRAGMSDRELLLGLHDRLDRQDEELKSARVEWVVCMRYLHSLNLFMGRRDEAQEIDQVIGIHRPSSMPAGSDAEKTHPGE